VIQRSYNDWFLPDRENENAHNLDSLCAVTKMIITKHSPQTDGAKHRCLMPLSESTSRSHYYDMESGISRVMCLSQIVKVIDSDKRTSLLLYRIDCDCKGFCKTGPR
jgi:hypothetical protein